MGWVGPILFFKVGLDSSYTFHHPELVYLHVLLALICSGLLATFYLS